MKALFLSVAFGVAVLLSAGAYAQAPAGAIAQCKDGTYFTGTSHKGACKGHQGVKEWLDKKAASSTGAAASDGTASTTSKSKKTKKAADSTTSTKTTPPPVSTATTSAAPTPTPAPAPAPAQQKPPVSTATTPAKTPTPPTPASQIQQKPGGGAGQVWVNASSKVYHCQGDEWYGKTKEGSYMTEAAAKAAGNHASHGKECGG
jgi:hypothetical protein